MLSAFFAKLGQSILQYILRKIVMNLAELLTKYIERLRVRAEQNKKDQESKPKYDQAIKEGTHEQIVKETEDRLNG